MSKKQLRFLIYSNIFVVFCVFAGVRWLVEHKLHDLWTLKTTPVDTTNISPTTSDLWSLQSTLIDAIARIQNSVVSISISKDIKFYVDDPSLLNGPWNIQQQTAVLWGGSGIIISKNWYIITNKHVVQDTTAKYSVTLLDGRTYNIQKIWFDDLLDIAILKITDDKEKLITDLVPATFLPLDTQLFKWQFVLAMGNSLSTYSHNVTLGILWGQDKQLKINKNNLYIWLYQTDALVNPGNSWGPLCDIQGNVLGITTAIKEWEGIAFALPLSQQFVTSTIKSIEMFGKISRPIVGIQYIDITPSVQQEYALTVDHGIYIKDVLSDLSADKAGIQIWDIILGINAHPISKQSPFLYQLYTYIPWDKISVDILRDNKQMTLDILLWWSNE